MKKIIGYIAVGVVCLALGYTIAQLSSSRLKGYNPQTPGFTGVYFTTTTANDLRDGYGGPVRIDLYGQVLISPSSTINIIGE